MFSIVRSLRGGLVVSNWTALGLVGEGMPQARTVLRYDGTSCQFIYNLKTPTGTGKCYRGTMTTQDGSTLIAYFKMK
jgi:hypothetical protein